MQPLAKPSASADALVALRERMPRKLRVFVGPEQGVWIAHAVDFDVVGQGDDADSAVESMFSLLAGHIQTAVELDEVAALIPHRAPLSVIAKLYMKSWIGAASRALRQQAVLLQETVYDRSVVEHRLQLS